MIKSGVNKTASNIGRCRWAGAIRSDKVACLPLFPPRTGGAPLSSVDQVLLFFLELFKLQNDIEPGAPARMALVEKRSTCPDETYEMCVLHRGEWVGRRISIGLLGQGGGSRSRCFYVIYDTHLVLKIPAQPIAELALYSQRVADENAIVARLAPVPCIVPGIAIIARSLPEFRYNCPRSDEKLEEKFFRLIKVTPAYRKYLKIGESYVFLMDLSKHFFLSTVLHQIHGNRDLAAEALQNPDLLWDHCGFVQRYGEAAAMIRHDLIKAFNQCEKSMQCQVESGTNGVRLPVYVLKRWFLGSLVGEKINPQEHAFDPGVAECAGRLIGKALDEHRDSIDQYCRLLSNYLQRTRFSKHHRHLEGLAGNTLVLLDWLNTKGLVLRDLKPENLFVTGTPENYPLFLTDLQKFSLGLIDVETAVVIDPVAPETILQPPLAGTPLFATPAHLLSNTILTRVYKDLRAILLLQDWYAAVAIIFRIVSGCNLFTRTAHTFPEVLASIKRLGATSAVLEKSVAKLSRVFWNSAVAEFNENLQLYADRFVRVQVRVPQGMVPQIIAGVAHEIECSMNAIDRLIEQQSFFPSPSKKQILKRATAARIAAMRTRLQAKTSTGSRDVELLGFLRTLEEAIQELERLRVTLVALGAAKVCIPADHLLKAMFQQVFSHMYLPHWPVIVPGKWAGKTPLPSDIVTYQATM